MQALVQQKGSKAALALAGDNHAYQLRTALIIGWQYLFRSFFLIYYAYLTQTPTFLCRDPTNPSISYDCTEAKGGCDEQIISPNSPSSLVIDLGLYCEKSYIRNLGSSLFFVGGNIGVAVFSYISDKKGRKPSMVYSYFVGSLALLGLGVAATGPFTYVLFLMLIWSGNSNYVSLSLTYITEISGERFARNASTLLLLSITVGELIIIGLAYFITNWQTLYVFAIGLPAFMTNLTFRMLDESPVFLETKGDYAGAAEVINKIAIVNERNISEELTKASHDLKVSSKVLDMPSTPQRNWNYLSIIIHPKLQVGVAVYSVIRLYLNLAYFGCIFALSSLGGSLVTNSVIAAVAEGLGYSLALYAYLFTTRKLLKYSLLVIIISGLCFLTIPILSCESSFVCGATFLQSVFSLVMRTAVCFVYGFIYSLGNEIFPPEVRAQSNGIGGVFADVGGMFAPMIIVFAEATGVSPLFLFGVLGLVPLLACQFIPEQQINIDDENQQPNNEVEMNYIRMEDKEPAKKSVTAN